MARIPLRFKLTLAFTGVMAVLLACAGFALSLLVAQNLDNTIDDGLARACRRRGRGRRRAHGRAASREHRRAVRPGALTADGSVRDTTTGAGRIRCSTATTLERRARAS